MMFLIQWTHGHAGTDPMRNARQEEKAHQARKNLKGFLTYKIKPLPSPPIRLVSLRREIWENAPEGPQMGLGVSNHGIGPENLIALPTGRFWGIS